MVLVTRLKTTACAAVTAAFCIAGSAGAQMLPAGVWHPDRGDGTYANPVLAGDYSDPDVVRVGDDFYLTASSFVNSPGLPVLHSKDLVNWTLIGYALPRLSPEARYAVPRHGGGVWAPAIRFHDGLFRIYYPDPDLGLFVVTAKDPAGPWSAPVLVDATRGAIDPCPFWDEDGQGYLVHAYAGSRAGFSNLITLQKLSADGLHTLDRGVDVLKPGDMPKVMTSQGPMPWFTTEGPKLYRRGGYYYIFAPSGSVKGGWQGVFRARSIYGPYEARSVLDQGGTGFNGPHQGAWVTAPDGSDWFIHFQDTDSYGRRVLLEPMAWSKDGWPLIGERQTGQVFGQPVAAYRKPVAGQAPAGPPFDDAFAAGPHLGWQWQANPADDWIDRSVTGRLRLNTVSSPVNLWEAGNVLAQKMPGTAFSVTVRVTLSPGSTGERAGLVVYGTDYAWIGLEQTADGPRLIEVTRPHADADGAEQVDVAPVAVPGPVVVRATLSPVTVPQAAPAFADYWPSMLRATQAKVVFSYSLDGKTFQPLGQPFVSAPGRWVGAQIGLFAQSPTGTPANVSTRQGHADFEDFVASP